MLKAHNSCKAKHTGPTAQPECMTALPVIGYETAVHQKQLIKLMPGTIDQWCSTRRLYKLVDTVTGEVVMQSKPAFWIWMQQAM